MSDESLRGVDHHFYCSNVDESRESLKNIDDYENEENLDQTKTLQTKMLWLLIVMITQIIQQELFTLAISVL